MAIAVSVRLRPSALIFDFFRQVKSKINLLTLKGCCNEVTTLCAKQHPNPADSSHLHIQHDKKKHLKMGFLIMAEREEASSNIPINTKQYTILSHLWHNLSTFS